MTSIRPFAVAALLVTTGCVGPNHTPTPSRSAVAAATSPEAVNAANAKMTDPEDRIVCRREQVVGSNRPEKVCMTVRQRREMQARADDLRQRADRSSGRSDQPIGPDGY